MLRQQRLRIERLFPPLPNDLRTLLPQLADLAADALALPRREDEVVRRDEREGGDNGETEEDACVEARGDDEGEVDALAEAGEAANAGVSSLNRTELRKRTHRNLTVIAPFAATSRPIPALTFSVTRRSALMLTLAAPTFVIAPPSESLTPPSTVLAQFTLTCLTNMALVASTPQPDAWFRPIEIELSEYGWRRCAPQEPIAHAPERNVSVPVVCR